MITGVQTGSETDLRLRLPVGAQVAVSSAVPSDMSTHLNKLRGDPLLWWRSQLFSYLMRPLPSVRRLYQTVAEQIHFKKPIIGWADDEFYCITCLWLIIRDYIVIWWNWGGFIPREIILVLVTTNFNHWAREVGLLPRDLISRESRYGWVVILSRYITVFPTKALKGHVEFELKYIFWGLIKIKIWINAIKNNKNYKKNYNQ